MLFFHYSQNEFFFCFLFFVFTSYKFVFVMNARTPKADGQVVDFSKKKKKKPTFTTPPSPGYLTKRESRILKSPPRNRPQTPWQRNVAKKKKKKKGGRLGRDLLPPGIPWRGITHTQSSFNSSGLHLAPARTSKTSPERAGRCAPPGPFVKGKTPPNCRCL